MMLLEHDAKVLLEEAGIRVPRGFLANSAAPPASVELHHPVMVKAQAPVGGRGKAGLIQSANGEKEADAVARRLLGRSIKGHVIRGCRIEECVNGTEAYLSLALDPARGRLNVLLSAQGGVDVEDRSRRESLLRTDTGFDPDSAIKAGERLAMTLPNPLNVALADAVRRLAPLFFELEATLIEINPLFIHPDGSWTAGDAKLALDENAFVRRPRLVKLVETRADAYPEAALKLSSGFDFVVLDPEGDIGLVTTGAGLSMQLVDELVVRGCRPFNFCDIRTGQFRGDPSRLIHVLQRIAAGPSVRSVLMNFFAGITHLGELASLLVTAIDAVPELQAQVTARLIGNGYDEALAILAAAGNPLQIEPDLERAILAAAKPIIEPRP